MKLCDHQHTHGRWSCACDGRLVTGDRTMMIRPLDTVTKMLISPEAHAAILRGVALTALDDARLARRKAHVSPSEESIRAAFRACVFATRALLRASEHHPDDEMEMIENAMLMGEVAHGLKARLVRLIVEAGDST